MLGPEEKRFLDRNAKNGMKGSLLTLVKNSRSAVKFRIVIVSHLLVESCLRHSQSNDHISVRSVELRIRTVRVFQNKRILLAIEPYIERDHGFFYKNTKSSYLMNSFIG